MFSYNAMRVEQSQILTRSELAAVLRDGKREGRSANDRSNHVIVRLACCCGLRLAGAGGSQVLEQLNAVEAREDLVRRLDDEFDRELYDEAAAQVRMRVTPRTWEAFERTAVQNQSGAEAAQALGMKVAAVFVARSKVQKMLREELAKLDAPKP